MWGESQSEVSWPRQPRVVQQREILPIVGDEHAAGAHCCQKLSIVAQASEANVPRGNDLMTCSSEQQCETRGHVVIEIQADQREGYASFSRMRASTYGLYRS